MNRGVEIRDLKKDFALVRWQGWRRRLSHVTADQNPYRRSAPVRRARDPAGIERSDPRNAHEGAMIFPHEQNDAGDIEHVAERLLVINHGRVIVDGPVAEIRRRCVNTRIFRA